ncbi:helix-turn-helix domain-containing protein [Nocardia sp. NPDC004340]
MAGSTLPRRALGRTLRGYRIRSGKGQLAAGLHIELSAQSIGRIEDGRKVKISTAQMRDLLDFYRVENPSKERDAILDLWEEVRKQDQVAKMQGVTKGWWRAYSDQFAPHFDNYLNLEASANHLTTHQLSLIPGLFQTAGYRRAVIRSADAEMSDADIERRLELAAHRRARLDDIGFRVKALLSEAVLRHRPGGIVVAAEQLRHLTEVATRANVSIRVVPFEACSHSGLGVRSFTILEFPPLSDNLVEPPIVYVDGYEGALYLDNEAVIRRHRQAVANLEQVALSEGDTTELVWSIVKEYQA